MEKVGIVLAAGKGTRMNSLYNQTAKVFKNISCYES